MNNNQTKRSKLEFSLEDADYRFRQIPAGGFLMGARGYTEPEEMRHRVRITRDFWLAETPLTQRQLAVLGQDFELEHQNKASEHQDAPADSILGSLAQRICYWLKLKFATELPSDHEFRLPTEAEWEYACRAGTETEYYSGDGTAALLEVGWFNQNSGSHTCPVGQLKPNEWGLFDMHGNVWERCRDTWNDQAYRHRPDPITDPFVHESSDGWAVRGGCFLTVAEDCRSSTRSMWGGELAGPLYGLRPGIFFA